MGFFDCYYCKKKFYKWRKLLVKAGYHILTNHIKQLTIEELEKYTVCYKYKYEIE